MLRSIATISLVVLVCSCAAQQKSAVPPAAVEKPIAPTPQAQRGALRSANSWTTNEAGLAIIQRSEGLKLVAYQLGTQWLIGYGHAKGVTAGMTISQEQAERYLKEDVGVCEGTVTTTVSVPVTRNEFSAMVSLCYNIGPQTFSKASVASKLNAGDRPGAADAFLVWNEAKVNGVKQKVPYLTQRRQAERALFVQPDAATS